MGGANNAPAPCKCILLLQISDANLVEKSNEELARMKEEAFKRGGRAIM